VDLLDVLGDPLPPGALVRLGTSRLRHNDIVTSVAYAPDGKQVASTGNDGTIRLWDPASGKEQARLLGHAGSVYGLAFSPDGKTLASAGRDGLVCLWETAAVGRKDNEPRKLAGHKDAVLGLAFAPDGKTLASAGHDGTLRIWDPAAGQELRHFGTGQGRVGRLAFTPDGKTLAATHTTGEFGKTTAVVHLWDPATGNQVRQIGGDQKSIYSLAISPDGLTLATGGDYGPKVWELASGSELAKLRFPLGSYTPCVLFSPDGNRLLAGGSGFLREWSVATGRPGRSFEVGQIYTYSAAFSPDGKTLVTGGTRTVTFWDLATAKPRHGYAGHQGEVGGFVFLPGGKELLTGGYDRPIYRWEIATGKLVGRLLGPMRDWNSTLALSPDGKTLAALGPDLSVVLLDADTGKERLKFTRHLPPRTSAHTAMAVVFSPDGETVISAAQTIDNTIRIWSAANGQELRKIEVPKGASTLAVSPDGKTLYSTNWEGPVRAWDVPTGQEVRTFEIPGRAMARLALSPDGRHLACASGGQVFVWDTVTGRELSRLEKLKGWQGSLVFSADGRTLAAVGDEDGVVNLWEVASGRVRWKVAGHAGAVKGLAFSPDGRILATGSSDTTALLWDFWGLPLATGPAVAGLTAKQLDALWTDLLAGDPEVAFRAVCRLARSPGQAVPFVGERLQPAPPKRIEKLIALLDDDVFEMREQATRELEGLGQEAEELLQKAAKDGPSAEIRARARGILTKLEKGSLDAGPRLRALRALEALETSGTAEARQVIEQLARGRPQAELTREARGALQRLANRAR
jgi:WD40 repeat protein